MELSEAQKIAEQAICDYTSSSKWQEVKYMKWTTAEMQDVIAKALVKNIEVIPCCKSDSEQLPIARCGCEEPDPTSILVCVQCDGYVE